MNISEQQRSAPARVPDEAILPLMPPGGIDSAHEVSPAIDRSRILVIVKTSKLKWDLLHTGLSQDGLLEYYKTQGECGRSILASHLRQRQVLQDLIQELSPSQFVSVPKVTRERVGQADLVIALGGDDHFKQVTHLIDDDTPVLGVNSDPGGSEGNILGCNAADLPQVLKQLESGDYRIEQWTRLRLSVDGRDFGPAIGEVALARRDFRLMTRHYLDFDGDHILQKSSGLLISTGTGSTGWFSSAGLYLSPESRVFERTAPYARFELREPHIRFEERDGARVAHLPEHVEGTLLPGQCLTVTSLNNSEGIATRDSIDAVPFNRGSVAEIRVDEKPLSVVMPHLERRSIQ